MTTKLLAVLLLLAACKAPAVRTDGTNNPDVRVDELFVHDGCTVYRFSDGGNWHYFARCGARGVSTEMQRTEVVMVGKVTSVRWVSDVVTWSDE